MATISFNGSSRRVTIGLDGLVTNVDSIDIYSAWKEWVAAGNAQWVPAFSNSVGGDPIGGGTYLGQYFFLNNDLGWRLSVSYGPANDEYYTVNIAGNIYGTDPNLPIIDNSGFNGDAAFVFNRSSLATGVATSGQTIDPADIAVAVWDQSMTNHNNPGSFGRRLKEILPTLWGIK